jgi:hypothetical protein
MPRLSSEQLLDQYRKGFLGAIWEEHVFEELLDASKYPYFGDGASRIVGSGKDKLSLPFKAVLNFDKKAYTERQTTGDCVSHSTRNAVDLSRAVEIAVKGEREGWHARSATEAIYGARGHGGQGMSCSRAATFVSKNGGILLRKNYPGIADFSKYNGNLGASWGGRGLPDKVIDEAEKHQVQTVSLIRTVEEARDALANGYGISVCSGYGFSNKRDSKGIARKSGSWAHAMAWVACDDSHERFKETLFLVQNSWGIWNSGPKVHDQPDGSFWIRESDAAGMLSGNGAYAFSNVNGFPPQKLSDLGFVDYL